MLSNRWASVCWEAASRCPPTDLYTRGQRKHRSREPSARSSIFQRARAAVRAAVSAAVRAPVRAFRESEAKVVQGARATAALSSLVRAFCGREHKSFREQWAAARSSVPSPNDGQVEVGKLCRTKRTSMSGCAARKSRWALSEAASLTNISTGTACHLRESIAGLATTHGESIRFAARWVYAVHVEEVRAHLWHAGWHTRWCVRGEH
jgi:hypothetical protein